MDMLLMEQEMMMMGGGGAGRAAGRAAGGGPGGAPVEAEDPNKDAVAITTPIELTIVGSNTEVMSFLYRVNNADLYFYVDKLTIQSVPQEENTVQATMVISVVSALFSDAAITQAQIQEQIDSLEQTTDPNQAAGF